MKKILEIILCPFILVAAFFLSVFIYLYEKTTGERLFSDDFDNY